MCACGCECVSARASECMGECVRSQAEAIITSWRPAPQPREPSCPPDRRVNHYAIPARSASTQTSGGRRRRTRAPEGVQRRFPSRSGGDAPYAALHGTPFSTTHSKLLLQRRAWLAESTVHESTLTVATAIPTPEQILARDEAMSTRNAGEAVMSRDSNRARMFPPAPRYLVLRPVGSPRANAPNAGVHAATKARGPPRVWSPPRPARPHAPRGQYSRLVCPRPDRPSVVRCAVCGACIRFPHRNVGARHQLRRCACARRPGGRGACGTPARKTLSLAGAWRAAFQFLLPVFAHV